MKPLFKPFTFVALLCASIFTISCNDDDEEVPVPSPPVFDTYYPLKTGNYWVYQRFLIDASGESPTSIYDSCYVEKDTLIGTMVYYKVIRPSDNSSTPNIYYLQNSNHYVIDHQGNIYFSSVDFSTVFKDYYITAGPTDTVCYVTEKMAEPNFLVTTPSGNYYTRSYKINYAMYPMWSSLGDNRARNTRYAKDIGIVTETLSLYASVINHYERRLIRYHLN